MGRVNYFQGKPKRHQLGSRLHQTTGHAGLKPGEIIPNGSLMDGPQHLKMRLRCYRIEKDNGLLASRQAFSEVTADGRVHR